MGRGRPHTLRCCRCWQPWDQMCCNREPCWLVYWTQHGQASPVASLQQLQLDMQPCRSASCGALARSALPTC